MSEQWTDDIEQLSDAAFMQIFRHPYWHNPLVKARLDAVEVPRYGPIHRPNVRGPQPRVEAEKARRGLVWPDSWESAGLDPRK